MFGKWSKKKTDNPWSPMVKLKTKKHIRVKINFLIVVDKITLYIDLKTPFFL